MQKQIARYWVIQNVSDCDAYNRGKAVGFGSRIEAERYANNSNEGSDGLVFHVISDFDELLVYCSEYYIDVPEYAHQTMETPPPPQRFARMCSATGEGMNSGWVWRDGCEYFKYESDMIKYVESQGTTAEEAYEADELYFTIWEDEGDYEYELINGELVEL